MTIKRVLCPERVRQLPPQFSWVDHRLVRERYLERCDPPAAALYLFLVTVADAQGLSYYSEGVLGRSLSLVPARLRQANLNAYAERFVRSIKDEWLDRSIAKALVIALRDRASRIRRSLDAKTPARRRSCDPGILP